MADSKLESSGELSAKELKEKKQAEEKKNGDDAANGKTVRAGAAPLVPPPA